MDRSNANEEILCFVKLDTYVIAGAGTMLLKMFLSVCRMLLLRPHLPPTGFVSLKK